MAEAWEPIRKQRSRREVRRPELREMVVAMGGSQGNLRGTWEVNEEKLRHGRDAGCRTGCRRRQRMWTGQFPVWERGDRVINLT